MKFGYNDVLELFVFDESEKLIANLDTLKSSKLIIENGIGYLIVEDATLDKDLFKFIHKVEKDNRSDYEKIINKQNNRTTITLNNKEDSKKYKLIGKGVLKQISDGLDKEFLFEAPYAKNDKHFDFDKDYEDGDPITFKYVFKLHPYNEQGDLVKMHIEE